MKTKILGAASLLAGVLFTAQAHADCGDVVIADMNWPSASFMANLDMFVLSNGYGCEVETVPGDTVPTGTSMIEKGEPDIAPELWTNSFAEPLETALSEGRLIVAGESLSDGGEEGFWVPKFLVDEHPELATIEGVRANPTLFDNPENPDMGAFYGCPAGWACQISSGNQFRALGLEDAGFELIDPGSAAGLDGALARAYERGKGWFGYYWAPTSILGKYEMVKVDFGVPVDQAHWTACIIDPDCSDPQPSMYPSSPVRTVTVGSFADEAPEAFDYLSKRSFANSFMNKLLVWIDENQADGETAAVYFLENNEDMWSAWVSEDAAGKIKAAIASM